MLVRLMDGPRLGQVCGSVGSEFAAGGFRHRHNQIVCRGCAHKEVICFRMPWIDLPDGSDSQPLIELPPLLLKGGHTRWPWAHRAAGPSHPGLYLRVGRGQVSPGAGLVEPRTAILLNVTPDQIIVSLFLRGFLTFPL